MKRLGRVQLPPQSLGLLIGLTVGVVLGAVSSALVGLAFVAVVWLLALVLAPRM